jgi:DNA primase
MSAIDEVKQKTDIVEVIGQYTALKKAGRNLTALCPFHSEKNPSFFVYPEQQSWHCFGACNTGGDVLSFIMKKEGLDFGEALSLLARRAGVTLPLRADRESDKDEKEELYRINEAAALYFHNLLLNSPAAEKARSYVDKRRFLTKTVADFQLGFSLDSWEALKPYLLERGYSQSQMLTAGLIIEAENGKTHDRFRGKLMFPIRDSKGRTIGFGARALDDSMPKYTNSPQTPAFDKSHTLYGLDLAAKAIRTQDAAVIMEGYMDVITAHQNGVSNAIASMGTAVTETQVSTLKKLTKNLLLAFDADIAGVEASQRGGEIVYKPSSEDIALKFRFKKGNSTLHLNESDLRDAEVVGTRIINEEALNINAKVIKLPKDKDPDDIIKEDIKIWEDLVNNAVPIVDFTFDAVTSGLDLTTARDKSLAVDRLLPIVAEIKDPVRQAHYIQKLARLVAVTERTLEAALSGMRPAAVRRKNPEPRQAAVTRALRPLMSSPLEADCLALLLHHPELKASLEGFLPEYFENSENREIFTLWQHLDDPSSLRERLDLTLHEHLDTLLDKDLPSTNVEQRHADYTRRLRERFLKNQAAMRAEIHALKAESGDSETDTTGLEEDLEISTQLRDVFTRKNHKQPRVRR